jgi:hypothetical protein
LEGITVVSKRVKTLLGPRTKEITVNILGPRIPRSQRETDNIADFLVEKFKSPEYRPLFLRAAWRLDRGTIERHVATAFELGNNPRAYFITLIKRERGYYEQ